MRAKTALFIAALVIVSTVCPAAQQEEDDRWNNLRKTDKKEYAAALKVFKQGIRSKEASERQNAVRTFSAVEDYRMIEELAKLLGNTDEALRDTAAQSLSVINDKRSAAALARALKRSKAVKDSPKTLVIVIAGLGRLNYWEASRDIKAFLDSDNADVKEAALDSLSLIVPAAYVDDIIDLYEADKKELAKAEKRKDQQKQKALEAMIAAELRSLSTITGESFEDPADYRRWWKKNASLFNVYGGLREGATPRSINKD